MTQLFVLVYFKYMNIESKYSMYNIRIKSEVAQKRKENQLKISN